MTSDQWWAVLLEGAVGSTLSVVALFITFWLTLRADARRSASVRELAASDAREERTHAAAMDAVRAMSALPLAETVPLREVDEFIANVCEKLLMFSSAARRDHDVASRWALAAWGEIARRWRDQRSDALASAEMNGAAVRPEHEAASTMTLVANTLGALTRWSSGQETDDTLERYAERLAAMRSREPASGAPPIP